jgi:hypothetical protein
LLWVQGPAHLTPPGSTLCALPDYVLYLNNGRISWANACCEIEIVLIPSISPPGVREGVHHEVHDS